MSITIVVEPSTREAWNPQTWQITRERIELAEIPREGDCVYLPSQDCWAVITSNAIHLGSTAAMVMATGCSPAHEDILNGLRSSAHRAP